ncbi:MAG: fibronectin type III domain-containing protein [Deltaproteobacteria bacterium]|nr:fibronectin type III domain-containing protein [Deltaproteobacteria bacterium]
MKTKNTFLLQSVFSPAKLFLFLILSISMLYSSAYSAEVTLQWDPNTEPDLAGYKIYYDTNSGAPYEGTAADQGASPVVVAIEDLTDPDQPEYTITGLTGSRDYFFAVTAFDNETPSLESDYSDEVTITTYTIVSSAGQDGSVSPAGFVLITQFQQALP